VRLLCEKLHHVSVYTDIYIYIYISIYIYRNGEECGAMRQYYEMVITSRIGSSGMLRRVALVRTDVSEELSASFIRVTRIGELVTGAYSQRAWVASYC
jgi:hypothetical protein